MLLLRNERISLMALTNAERQALHRERVKQKLAEAAKSKRYVTTPILEGASIQAVAWELFKWGRCELPETEVEIDAALDVFAGEIGDLVARFAKIPPSFEEEDDEPREAVKDPPEDSGTVTVWGAVQGDRITKIITKCGDGKPHSVAAIAKKLGIYKKYAEEALAEMGRSNRGAKIIRTKRGKEWVYTIHPH
jgi:hypothetical protein